MLSSTLGVYPENVSKIAPLENFEFFHLLSNLEGVFTFERFC